MTRGRWQYRLLTALIASIAITDCDQSKPTSPGNAAPDVELRFAKAPETPSVIKGVSILMPISNPLRCLDIRSAISGDRLAVKYCDAPTKNSQRWTFTDNSDGTNLIVDYRGMCADGSRPKGEPPANEDNYSPFHPVPLAQCALDRASRFRVTLVAAQPPYTYGKIVDEKSGLCLSARETGSDVVLLAECQEVGDEQLWLFYAAP